MGKDINAATIDAATTSVEICIGLIGIMALWLGLLQIAQDSGMVAALARLLRPLMHWLFPDVPDGHPAQGAILMNLSANMLGLDNAATPLGLKAMEELQTLNTSQRHCNKCDGDVFGTQHQQCDHHSVHNYWLPRSE